MAADGDIDYGGYTTAQLREAISSIDRSRFPLNFDALQRELGSRAIPTSIPNTIRQDSARVRKPGRKRPVLVWIVLVLYAFLMLAGAASVVAATTGAVKLPDSIARYYAAFSFWDYARVAISIALGTAMVVNLYRMRRIAFQFALTMYLYGQAVAIWRYEELKVLGYGPAQLAWGFIIGALLSYYLWRLSRKGLLT